MHTRKPIQEHKVVSGYLQLSRSSPFKTRVFRDILRDAAVTKSGKHTAGWLQGSHPKKETCPHVDTISRKKLLRGRMWSGCVLLPLDDIICMDDAIISYYARQATPLFRAHYYCGCGKSLRCYTSRSFLLGVNLYSLLLLLLFQSAFKSSLLRTAMEFFFSWMVWLTSGVFTTRCPRLLVQNFFFFLWLSVKNSLCKAKFLSQNRRFEMGLKWKFHLNFQHNKIIIIKLN